MGCWRSFGLFCMYELLNKKVPFSPELPILSSSLVPLDCYLAALYYFFHTIPSLDVCNTGSFSLQTLFSKASIIFVTLWDSSHFKSILWKTDSIQSEIIPTWSYRTCVSTLIPWLFHPAVSFPMLTEVLCTALVCTHVRVVLSQRYADCRVRWGGCFWTSEDAATESKMPLSAIQLFLHKQQF